MTKVTVMGYRLFSYQKDDGTSVDGAEVAIRIDDNLKGWDGSKYQCVSLTGQRFAAAEDFLAVGEPFYMFSETYTWEGRQQRSYNLIPIASVRKGG